MQVPTDFEGKGHQAGGWSAMSMQIKNECQTHCWGWPHDKILHWAANPRCLPITFYVPWGESFQNAAMEGRAGKEEEKRKQEGKGAGGRKGGRKLELVDEFFMTLIRLRLGLYSEDIAQRFGISVSYFSKIFTTWIVFLSKELRLLFPFPSQKKVRDHMPARFSAYPNTRVVIDCFEIFIERPSLLKANCATFSNHKNHNTFKCLVGVSPASCVTYMSDLWTGRVSDKMITKHCGLVDLLSEGDNVMADRGFDVQDILSAARVTLNIPPTLPTSRSQFTLADVDKTRRIASVWIFVGCAIGRIKGYHILALCRYLSHLWLTTLCMCVAIWQTFYPCLLQTKLQKFCRCVLLHQVDSPNWKFLLVNCVLLHQIDSWSQNWKNAYYHEFTFHTISVFLQVYHSFQASMHKTRESKLWFVI